MTTTQYETKKQWIDKYWFSPLQMITLINPRSEDYKFKVEMRHFIIRAGAQEQFPGTVANVYLSHMTRILAQEEDKMQHLSDWNLMAKYYDTLIVDVKNMMNDVDTEPEYMKHMPEHTLDKPPETPPWQQNGEKASNVPEQPKAPETPPTPPQPPKPTSAPAKAETKEFDYQGAKYKVVIAKDGRRMYYKDGKMTSEAVFSKAASML